MAVARFRRKRSAGAGAGSFRSSCRERKDHNCLAKTSYASYPSRTDELFKDPQPVSIFQPTSNSLSWYHAWLHSQVENVSHPVRELRIGEKTLLEDNTFERIFAAVATFVQEDEGLSIDDIVEYLRRSHDMESTREVFKAQRWLVFAVLGWQSMLYRPAFNNCSLDELAVQEEDDQPRSGLVFDTNKVPANLADRPLFVILKAFGNLLPSTPMSMSQHASLNSKAATTWRALNPAEINAHFLLTLLHVRIRWVDSLSLHMDYNKSNRTLSLFSCPSFCVAMLQSKGPIFSFASTEKNSFDPRGNEKDITQLMREVLLSFRLLFGQHSRSRKIFPKIYRPTERLRESDQLLPRLCMIKHIEHSQESQFLYPDQPVYYATQHFPVLNERIEILANELKHSRPTSIRELLHDRRDTLQFWTFWLVSIIGGTSVILSLVQVILQASQLARE